MNPLSQKIALLIENAKLQVAKSINMAMVLSYYNIGKLIIENIQEGEKRAKYGKKVLQLISLEITKKFGRGFSVQNLERMRNFYQIYSNSSNTLRNSKVYKNSSNALRISINKNEPLVLLPLSWSHYLFLIRIKSEKERQFYEIEAYTNQWILSELERQYNSGLFERLSLSKNKTNVLKLSQEGQIIKTPQDIIKDPLILEFLGLEEKTSYSETDLETAIINRIEFFMLELGKGFFFGGRQVRFTFDEEHFFIDLVFYNRLLQCFVLIDLKIGKLKHQDIGQMQMYINYYDRFVKKENENPTIGIIICKDKKDAIIEITLPKNNTQLFATKYQTILPSKEQLKQLIEKNK